MEGNVAATYTLVYRFLRQQSQSKAAEAVKKAAKPFVVLRDDIDQKGPPLEDIIKEWQAKENARSEDVSSSSEDSESSNGSSSDEEDSSDSNSSSQDTSGSESEDDDTGDSDDSSDDSEDTKTKKSLQKAVERDTSATLSSAGDNMREVAKQAIQMPEKSTKDKNEDSESDSSGSNSSSTSSVSDSSDAETSSGSSDSSSSSDSSDDDEASENKKALAKAPPKTTDDKETSSSSESSSDSDDDESDSGPESQRKGDAHVAKKRKTSEHGAAVATAVSTRSQEIARPLQKKEKPPPQVKERFQRVKVQNIEPDLLLNNGYEARGGAANDYGQRAHRDLIVTRGAGFRKEKNKKKRGSYRGGEITMESHSIKFD